MKYHSCQVQMPLRNTFFSPRFGMVADKFGVGGFACGTLG